MRRSFLRKDSSFAIHRPKPTERNPDDNHMSDDNGSNDLPITISPWMPPQMLWPCHHCYCRPRSNDSNAYNDMFSPSKAPSSSFLCSMSLCFTGDDLMVLLNHVIFHMLVGVYHNIVMNDLIP